MDFDHRTPLTSEKQSKWTVVTETLLVRLFWSSRFAIVKNGLDSLEPLTIAGLRYSWGLCYYPPSCCLEKITSGVLWLALVNTALGYWIYNRTLRK